MMRAFIVSLLLGGVTFAAAQKPADPLSSGACMLARNELEKALADPDPGTRRGRLDNAREAVARLCLGASARPRGERSGAPDPVRVVPPPVITGMPEAVLPPVTTPPPPPVEIPRPTVITACDPAGCWDSQGRRLNSIGPALVGPGGVCSVQGGVVNCP